jgi:hypothetical protein
LEGSRFGGTGLLALLIAGLGACWTSCRTIRPLDRTVAISNHRGDASLDERIPLTDGDDREFAELITALIS